jgi:hypothetical protein
MCQNWSHCHEHNETHQGKDMNLHNFVCISFLTQTYFSQYSVIYAWCVSCQSKDLSLGHHHHTQTSLKIHPPNQAMKSDTPFPLPSPWGKVARLKLATYLHLLTKLANNFSNTPASFLCMVLNQKNHFSVIFLIKQKYIISRNTQ